MPQSVLEYLEHQCDVRPDAIAVSDLQQQISFRSLRRRAQAIATRLGPLSGKPVGVFAHHAAETVTLFLAVLYAGGFYVPLDPALRPEKFRQIAGDAQFSVVLGSQSTPDLSLPDGCAYLCCDSAVQSGPVDQTALEAIAAGRRDTDPMYLIYTSGSTGVPKGVLKDHGAVLAFAESFATVYPLESSDIIGGQTPFFFDASTKDLVWMLRFGCQLEVLDRGLFSQPVNLVQRLNDVGVTTISWVPSALCIVAQMRTFADILPETLRRIFFIGEVFPAKYFNYWYQALPDAQFVNLYGSSELAGACCHYMATAPCPEDGVLPIGAAFPGTQIFLLDGQNPVTAPGKTGEICVASRTLAQCYYRDSAKTEISFVWWEPEHVRLFRTGDFGRYDEMGRLVFAARADHQIKHMGYRIELGEIEAAAGAIPGVRACACAYDTQRSKIYFFCEPEPAAPLTKALLQKELRARLSPYMVPNKIVILPAMPQNANGKIDRQALAALLRKD